MNKPFKSEKGVSMSGVRLLEKAIACDFEPSKTSCGPRRFLRVRTKMKAGKSSPK